MDSFQQTKISACKRIDSDLWQLSVQAFAVFVCPLTNHLSENDFFVQLLLFLPNSEAFIPLLGCSCLSGRFTEACPCWYLYLSVVRTCSGFYSEPLANGAEKQNPTAKATLTVYADWAPWWTALPFNLLTPSWFDGKSNRITKFDRSPGCDIEPHPFCLLSAPGGFQLSPLKASLGEVMHPPSPALYHRA